MTAGAADPTLAGLAPGLESPEWGGFDPSRTEAPRSGETWRGFRAAVDLGWKMEANWTDPFLFFVYSVAKPVSAALILVELYLVLREFRRTRMTTADVVA